MQPTRTYEISARLDVLGSPLGRLILSRCNDERASASWWIVAVTILSVALVAAYASAATLPGGPAGPLGQSDSISTQLILPAASVLLLVICCPRNASGATVLVGRRLRIDGRDRYLDFDVRRVRVRTISRELYYAHYARYAATLEFTSHLREEDLVLIEVDGKPDAPPVIIELNARDRSDLMRRLERHAATLVAAESVMRADAA